MNNYYYETKTLKGHLKFKTNQQAIKYFKNHKYVKLWLIIENNKDKILILKKNE